MNDLKKSQHAALVDFHNKAHETLAKLENSTQEAVEKALNSLTSPNSGSITPFTGYYAVAGGAGGAFLSIDTVVSYYRYSQRITLSVSSVTVTVSMDGKTSKTYNLDSSTTFDGKTLTIPGVLRITLVRQYNDGVLVTFSGTIYNTAATGSTRFNPLTLSTFNGNYAITATSPTILSVNDSETIPFDSSVAFDFGSGLTGIKFYTFTPLMFVLMFHSPDDPTKTYILMLGTAGARGLACYIQQGTGGEYAFTIPV